MWQYNNTELYHVGVPGMHWGYKKGVASSIPKVKKVKKHFDPKKVVNGKNFAQASSSRLTNIVLGSIAGAILVKRGHVEVGTYLTKLNTLYNAGGMVGEYLNRKK